MIALVRDTSKWVRVVTFVFIWIIAVSGFGSMIFGAETKNDSNNKPKEPPQPPQINDPIIRSIGSDLSLNQKIMDRLLQDIDILLRSYIENKTALECWETTHQACKKN